MLMNNLDPEVAERPDDLVVYGGTGRAARSWEALDAIVASLVALEDDETLLVQSGKPVAVFRTHQAAPRVLIANSNLVGRWATWEKFRELERAGLMMYGQMTAGSWIYIGSQGIVQGTYETFGAVAERHFGGSLAGRVVPPRGSAAWARAADRRALHGPADSPWRWTPRVSRRARDRICDRMTRTSTRRWRGRMRAPSGWRSPSGWSGTRRRSPPSCTARARFDVVTNQTSAHDMRRLVPAGIRSTSGSSARA